LNLLLEDVVFIYAGDETRVIKPWLNFVRYQHSYTRALSFITKSLAIQPSDSYLWVSVYPFFERNWFAAGFNTAIIKVVEKRTKLRADALFIRYISGQTAVGAARKTEGCCEKAI